MNINKMIQKLQKMNNKVRVVFPEGENKYIQEVAQKLIQEKILQPVLVFETQQSLLKFDIEGVEKIAIEGYDLDFLAQEFFTLRKGKLKDIATAKKMIQQSNYFSTMLLHLGVVDAYLGGITYTTKDTILPGLQIIKTKPEVSIISSTMILKKETDIKYFSDIAINIDPNAQQLSQISLQCADLIHSFGEDVNMALLSFSTKGSANHPLVDKVISAGKILDQETRNFNYDYELQFDAAVVEEVRTKKAPNSQLSKAANAFIFPDLNAANIGYKIAQRMGNYEAIGPIVTGFNKTINDLSRGANVNEIFDMAIISAIQSSDQKN